MVRYSFTAGDSHPLLLAGLPAHTKRDWAMICAAAYRWDADEYAFVREIS